MGSLRLHGEAVDPASFQNASALLALKCTWTLGDVFEMLRDAAERAEVASVNPNPAVGWGVQPPKERTVPMRATDSSSSGYSART